jgi:tetratricopeptide (TPR) repeat protein
MVSTTTASITLVVYSFLGLGALAADTLAASPPVPLPPEMKADILMARKMYREAIDFYSLAPDTAARANKIGIAYHQLLDLSAAKRSYEQALRLDPGFGEARNNLGTIYYSQKSYRRAIREYKKALRALPASASVYSNMGTAYFSRQEYKKASEAYEQAVKLDPDVFEHHSSYGTLMQERSITELAKFHYYLAKMYAKEGSTERALQYVRKALEEGFLERKKFLEDPEFTALHDNVEFQQILKSDPRVL